jgi:hypothetical protein
MIHRIIAVGLLLATSAFAAAPVGMLESTAPVQIGRVTVGDPVVPAWLVMAGDRVTTRSTSATLTLKTGAVYVIPARSVVVLSALGVPVRASGSAPVLTSPAATFSVAATPAAVSPSLPVPQNPGTPPSKRR